MKDDERKGPRQLSPLAAKNAEFRALARQAPEAPGVYIMRDENNTIIYVGKAKILRNRLLSYFSGKKDIKTRHLVERVAHIEWVLAGSEYDALIMENNFIKEHSPRYNINLKDGKTYPSIRITAEEFPRVFRTRRIINDGSEYFGPFPSAEVIDTYLELIKRLFPLRRCTVMKKRESPCMYYHIGRCPGPCAGRISHEAYMERVQEVRKLLMGETDSLLADLRRKMEEAATAFKFEEAAQARDAIKAVEQFAGRTSVQDFDPEARDYLAWHSDGDLISLVVFQMRDGRLRGRDSFIAPLYSSEEEAIETFMMSYYSQERKPPARLYLKSKIPVRPLKRYFKAHYQVTPEFLIPDSSLHSASMQMAVQNAKEELIRRRREIGDMAALAELKSILDLETLPVRIEGFDIAHLAGKFTVASLVSFHNGIPDKKNYRYFKIKSLGGAIDDFASIREAVARRYTRLINEEAELPDLILIDGGAGQVSAAREILDELGLDCGLAGLAKKNEEIYLPDRIGPIVLPKDSPALRVLVAVRDETHRFATGLSKKLRTENLKFTVLEAVPGIGEKRAKKLLKIFGSLKEIAMADVERIADEAGISRETALMVKEKAGSSYGL
ncbi:MAG: excinuclease ABC subunit UvrC [Spirochaetia bacterium]|nr:excinuclease ABC subunit UvrC [Spirochaetia bacterium]